MSTNEQELFVRNLALTTDSQTLQKHFSKFGNVKRISVPWNTGSKSNRGFAFVLFEDASALGAALAASQGHMIDDVKVTVSLAKGKSSCDKSKIVQEILKSECEIFVRGLSASTNCEILQAYFSKYGQLKKVAVPWNVEQQCSKSYGFVQFDNVNSVQSVLGVNHQIDGVKVHVQISKKRSTVQQHFKPPENSHQIPHENSSPTPDPLKNFSRITLTRSQFETLLSTANATATAATNNANPNNATPTTNKLNTKEKTDQPTSEKKKTVWAYHVEGDVEIPEICVFSITNTCSYNDLGCKRLHAKCPLQWQFERNGHWYNFNNFHSKEIEEAFQKPESDGVNLTPIDTNKMNDEMTKNLYKHLGSSAWKADFEKMNISTWMTTFNIRRISTHSSVLSNNKMATDYEWYFKDEFGKWIEYGSASSAGLSGCLPNISSRDVEIKFTKEKVSSFEFKSSQNTYVMDFSKMSQTNKATLVSRPVRRRPAPQNKSSSNSSQNNNLPSYWGPINSSLVTELFILKSTDLEYQKFEAMIAKELPKMSVVMIQRNQNPFLWNAYQNKKQFLMRKNNCTEISEMYLFHGTDMKNISAICEQNLDWRLHGTNVGQVYGRGTYFSNSASFSADYIRSTTKEKKFLIVKVIVGTTTKGDATMTRPPMNNLTNSLYDTTVDNVASPKVFVKYDMQEYYPEYVVTVRPKTEDSSCCVM